MAHVKLPDITKLRIVAFHYDPQRNPKRVVLQVPATNFKSEYTYRLDLDNAQDTEFIITLKEGLKLYDAIKLFGHVAYSPKTGEFNRLEDKNDKSTVGRLHAVILQARGERYQSGPFASKWGLPKMRRSE
jgi:hypothetical protein